MNTRILTITLMITGLLGMAACSDDDNPVQDNILFESSISATTLNKVHSITRDADAVDQVRIASVRILVKDMKMKLNGDERLLHAGPAVLTVRENEQSIVFARADVPAGQFDKVSWDIHRFESSALEQYRNDPVLADFTTDARHTIIITGTVDKDGSTLPFDYRTDVVGNLNFDFNPAVAVADDKVTIVEFQFQSDLVFRENGALVDPNDPASKSHLDNQVKKALKAVVH